MFSECFSVATEVPVLAVGEKVLTAEELRRPHALRNFQPGRPERSIFPRNDRPLRTKAKREIYRRYRRGESVPALAQRFNQSQSRVQRIINKMRAARIMELPLDCVGHDHFTDLGSQKMEEILGPMPECDLPQKNPRLPRGLPAYLASLDEIPLLTREQEAHLFRKMNYLKYRAGQLREQLDRKRRRTRLMQQIESLYAASVAARNHIIRANLRLVISIAKRHVGRAGDFYELVSDANLWLIRAVEKFDVSRGFRFCTYATTAIGNNFSHTIPAVLRDRARFLTSHGDALSDIETRHADPHLEGSLRLWRESYLKRVLRCLDERELQIIQGRFGLIRRRGPLTLKQLGESMGVSKERIRQIECRAIVKLKKATEGDRFDFD